MVKRWVMTGVFVLLIAVIGCDHPESPVPGTIPDLASPTYWKINDYLQIYFTNPANDTSIDNGLVSLIDSQTSGSIYIAFYDFDRENVIQALENAIARGVHVYFVGDIDEKTDAGYERVANALDANTTFDGPTEPRFANPNTVDFNMIYSDSIMHNKFALVMADNTTKTLWCGSTNVTDNGFVYNNNNALIIKNDAMYVKYKQYFDHLLAGGTGANANISDVYTATLGDIPVEYMFSYKSSGRTSPNLPVDKILAKVNAAVHDLYFMIFTFTRADISDAIIARKNAGLTCQGVFDEFQTGASNQAIFDALTAAGVPVKLDGNKNYNTVGGAMLHHKVMVLDHDYDSAWVITGSFNWTTSANEYNAENIIFINSADVAYAYYKEYTLRWKEAQ